MNEIRAIDLCCGAGGWACAARGLPIRITRAFDRWPEAAKTYEINHPATQVIVADLLDPAVQGRIRGLKGQVDLVLGGIPCEQVTVYRNVWNPRTRVTAEEIEALRRLLDACLDLVHDLKPRWWCLEDVSGVARHLRIMTPYCQIDAAGYSPQRRKRLYVGDFPRPLRGESAELAGNRLGAGPYRVGPRQWPRAVKTSHQFDGKSTAGLSPGRKSPTICDFGPRRDAELAVLDDRLPGGKRQLMWQEAAGLQGFPEDYLFYGSETAVWKMIGQAIQIDTGRAILEAIVADAKGEGA
jgi:site-specific DNA-cytosine methylase